MRWTILVMCIVAALALGFGAGRASCRSGTMLRHWPISGRDPKPIEADDLRSFGAIGGSCIFLDDQAVVVLDRSGELPQVHLDLAATVAMNTLMKAGIEVFRKKFLGKSAAELDRLFNTGESVGTAGSGGDASFMAPGGGREAPAEKKGP